MRDTGQESHNVVEQLAKRYHLSLLPSERSPPIATSVVFESKTGAHHAMSRFISVTTMCKLYKF